MLEQTLIRGLKMHTYDLDQYKNKILNIFKIKDYSKYLSKLTIELSPEDQKYLDAFYQNMENEYCGAIGGRVVIKITPNDDGKKFKYECADSLKHRSIVFNNHINGRFTYLFCITTLGNIFKIYDNIDNEIFDLTDYEDW